MSLTVYTVLGQVVQVVDQGYKPAGEYIYNVNMDRFASGVYFYTLRQGTNSITKKMLLLK
jgi:ribulose bisphosphate carboxylase small subunit